MHRAAVRSAVRMDPQEGKSATILGQIDNITPFSAIDRYNLRPGSMGADQFVSKFGSEFITQITIRVDDRDWDPTANDFRSYTVWAPTNVIEQAEVNDIVEAEIVGEETWVDGVRWIATSIVLLA